MENGQDSSWPDQNYCYAWNDSLLKLCGKTCVECTGEPANQQLKVSAVTVGRVNSVVVSAVWS